MASQLLSSCLGLGAVGATVGPVLGRPAGCSRASIKGPLGPTQFARCQGKPAHMGGSGCNVGDKEARQWLLGGGPHPRGASMRRAGHRLLAVVHQVLGGAWLMGLMLN